MKAEAQDLTDPDLQDPDSVDKTGWPPGLLQDDCRGLSKWLASKPDARRRLREAIDAINQEANT